MCRLKSGVSKVSWAKRSKQDELGKERTIGSTDLKPITIFVDSEFRILVPRFIESWKSQVQEIRTALEINDFESIRTSGHNMKGIGEACGFDFISSIGHELEKAAGDMCKDKVMERLCQLTSYLQCIEVVYI
jgi:HPt (histidine-containing phosphotransfer) domain-containing protein